MSKLYVSILCMSLSLIGSCGSRLPREVDVNRPVAAETALDLTKVTFIDLTTQETVNLDAYMKAKGLRHLLLTFGSRGCAACMEKARYFQANLADTKTLSLTADFALAGVSTDPASNRSTVVQAFKELGLSHITWSDPDRDVMMKYFQPAGLNFSVPLTVMLNERGILWRYSSKDTVTPEEIVNRVLKTLGENQVVHVKPPEKPRDPILPALSSSVLGDERPDRLRGVETQTCDGKTKETIDQIMAPAKLRFVIVDKGSCEAQSVCDQNRQAIQAFLPSCSSKSCQLMTVAAGALSSTACTRNVYQGGQEFFDIFWDHFNWSYTWTKVSEGSFKVPPTTGSLIFAFGQDGRLLFSKEGAVTTDELIARWNTDAFTERAAGPAFPIQSVTGTQSFSTYRKKAKWSVVLFWNTWCGSCQEEITEWHKPGHLLSFCQERPDFCQVMGLETGYPDTINTSTMTQYVQGLQHGSEDFEGFDSLGWTMPLGVDPTPFVDELHLRRWFDGWVRARFGGDYRSVLFDREGKVRGTWIAEPGKAGPLEELKKRLNDAY